MRNQPRKDAETGVSLKEAHPEKWLKGSDILGLLKEQKGRQCDWRVVKEGGEGKRCCWGYWQGKRV